MQVSRKFEKQGPLWVPRYEYDTPGKRYERYRWRQRFSLATIVQKPGTLSTANANTVAVTVASTGAGNLLVLGSFNSDTRTVSSIADNIGTNSYIQAASAAGTNGALKTDIWHCLSTSAGVTTITLTFLGAAGTFDKILWCYELSGFISPLFDLANNNSGTSVGNSVPGASVTTTSIIGFILGLGYCWGGVVANPTGGNEFTSGSTTTGSVGACSLLSSTAAAHAPAWTNGSDGVYLSSVAAYYGQPPPPLVPNPLYSPFALQQRMG